MAGSYRHCRAKDGSFRFNLIENLGDAEEACEMMYYMIDWLSKPHMIPLTNAKPYITPEDTIKDAEDAYHLSVNPTYKRSPYLKDHYDDDDEEE